MMRMKPKVMTSGCTCRYMATSKDHVALILRWMDGSVRSLRGLYVENEVGVVGVEPGGAAAEVEDPDEDEDE